MSATPPLSRGDIAKLYNTLQLLEFTWQCSVCGVDHQPRATNNQHPLGQLLCRSPCSKPASSACSLNTDFVLKHDFSLAFDPDHAKALGYGWVCNRCGKSWNIHADPQPSPEVAKDRSRQALAKLSAMIHKAKTSSTRSTPQPISIAFGEQRCDICRSMCTIDCLCFSFVQPKPIEEMYTRLLAVADGPDSILTDHVRRAMGLRKPTRLTMGLGMSNLTTVVRSQAKHRAKYNEERRKALAGTEEAHLIPTANTTRRQGERSFCTATVVSENVAPAWQERYYYGNVTQNLRELDSSDDETASEDSSNS